MDTVYMNDRAYRLVETLRRENRREERRLDKRLFSKQGLAALHQQELASVTEEQRRIREELTRIRRSTATTWGVLPPRQGEPAAGSENKLRDQSHDKSRADKSNRSRQVTDTSTRHNEHDDQSTLSIRHSDPGPSPGQSRGHHSKRKRKMKKKSMRQLSREDQKTKATLLKFNETFPSAEIGVMQFSNLSLNEAINLKATDELPAQPILVESLPRPADRDQNPSTSAKLRRPNRPIPIESPARSQPSKGLPSGDLANIEQEEQNHSSSDTGKRMYVHIKGQNNEDGICNENKENLQPSVNELQIDETDSKRTNMNVPTAWEVNQAENGQGQTEVISVSPTKSQKKTAPLAHTDVIEARDNISRRLTNENPQTKVEHKRDHASSPKGPRTLSPIEEQKTQLALVSSLQKEETLTQKKSTKKTNIKRKKTEDHLKTDMPRFDSYRYNPDGSVRTMHQLPDFAESLKEAQKARYLRQKGKQWYDKELTVRDIFGKDC